MKEILEPRGSYTITPVPLGGYMLKLRDHTGLLIGLVPFESRAEAQRIAEGMLGRRVVPRKKIVLFSQDAFSENETVED